LWRLDASLAGSGVTGDLLAHCIDTAMWLNEPIDSVTAMSETFVKERVRPAATSGGRRQSAVVD
jgi:predicted dehydrogenase